MTLYFQLSGPSKFLREIESADTASCLIAVTNKTPALPETPPSSWIEAQEDPTLRILVLDTPEGCEALSALMKDVPLYRITLELLIDKILMAAAIDPVRMKGVRKAFAPEEPPEAMIDAMSERHAFAGALHFPVIASRTESQLLDLYLKLYGPACPEHTNAQMHLAAILGGYPARLTAKCDGILWRHAGWMRLDRIVYDADRMDHDPEITFESYVVRGRAAAESLAVNDPEALLAAWISAERVQRELAHDIDAVLSLPDIRRLPRWVRGDVFRILEREAMKQVFADAIVRSFGEWPALRRTRSLAEPIEANAKGEVGPLIQQILNQTLSADARYAGAGEAFAIQAERRWNDAKKLLGK